MKYELKDVLAANPFKDVADKWIADIKKMSSDYNPVADNNPQFVLEEDVEAIKEFNRTVRTDKKRIVSQLLPEPFVGNIEAPIWILQINPSYNPIDYYSTISVNEDTKRFLPTKNYRVCTQENASIDERAELDKRLDLLAAQLKLEANQFIYLNECFNLSDQIQRSDNSYAWWHRALFGKNGFFKSKEEVDEKVFVLEGFPYHAKQIGDWRNIATKYREFWLKAIDYASQEGKILLCRSKKQFNQLIDSDDSNKLHVHFFNNPRCGSLSQTNLDKDAIAAISDVIDKLANRCPCL